MNVLLMIIFLLQDMDMESTLDLPTDIDEIEKAKAIESIVLDTSAEDSCKDDFEESDILVGPADSSANITNSLYDADESLKSTDIENGSETTEIKEKDLDSLDGEHSTNVLVSEANIPSQLNLHPQSHSQSPPQSRQIIIGNAVVTESSIHPISSPPSQSTANKVMYVKLLHSGGSSQPVVVSTTSQSPPKTYSMSSLKSRNEKSFEKPEVKKLSPIKMPAVEEPTTSSVAGNVTPPKPVEHTVNLLNNNRILIKSVKPNHATSPVSMPTALVKNAANEGFEFSSQKCDAKQLVNETSEITVQNVTNVKATTEQTIDQLNVVNETKCEIDANNGKTEQADSELEIKKEQILNENSTDAVIEDDTNSVDEEIRSKIKREFEKLQKVVNEAKVMAGFVIEPNKHNRRPTKSGKGKHNKYNNSLNDMTALVDEKVPPSVQLNRSASPSSSSVRSASKESDRSATSGFGAGKRNTRSMNTDFSAKQKQFLKGIQQVTRGTDDETDNNSGVDDDEDDVDYYAKQQPNIVERRKSFAASKSFSNESKTSDVKVSQKLIKVYLVDIDLTFGVFFFSKSFQQRGWDKYCWRCHQHESNLFCSCCVRSYHANCLKMKVLSQSEMAKWQCPECVEIKAAEKENKKK